MKKLYTFKLDIHRAGFIKLPGVVNGDTANVFRITVTDNGVPVSFDTDLNKIIAVFKRADREVYTQDAESGLDLSEAVSGTIIINVRPSSFATGKNTIELQIYTRSSTSAETYDDLITTQYAEYTARSATLSKDAPNAPSQLPMLEQLIADATAAIAAANAAAAAANAAAALVKLNGMPYLLTPTDVTHPTATSIDCGVEQTYAEIMATHTDTVYRPLCIVLDGYLLYERSYENRGDAGLMVTMTADTGMGTSINATLVAQSRFGGIVGITALYEHASDSGDDSLYVLNVQTPYWNGDSFEGDADKTTEEVVAAIDAGRTLAVRIADSDDETVYTMIEAYSQPDAHEVRCESKQAYCTVYAIGSTVQIHGTLRVISEDDVV